MRYDGNDSSSGKAAVTLTEKEMPSIVLSSTWSMARWKISLVIDVKFAKESPLIRVIADNVVVIGVVEGYEVAIGIAVGDAKVDIDGV